MTKSQVRTGIFVACIIVPVRTENCLRHSWQRHTRRSLIVPPAVRRLVPLVGATRATSVLSQWAQIGVPLHRRASKCS